MKKRSLLGIAAIAPITAVAQKADLPGLDLRGGSQQGAVGAGLAMDPTSMKPYAEIAKPITEDSKLVLSIFSFTCPFCRDYHDMIANWASGLPDRWVTHGWMPAVVDRESMTTAAAFFAAKRRIYAGKTPRVAAKELADWMRQAYALAIETRGLSSKQHVMAWAQLAGKNVNLAAHKDDVMHSASRVVRYGITATPSIAMGGRYVITPEIAAGKPDVFLKLANGVASMVLSDLGYRE